MSDLSHSTSARSWSIDDLKIFDICHHIHRHAEDFYLYLAHSHKSDRALGRTWGLLAIDKCNHSDTFKFAERLKGHGVREITLSHSTAQGILNKMKTLPKIGAGSTSPPSAEDAIRFSVKMEEALNSVHFSKVIRFQSEHDSTLMASGLKSSTSIMKMITELQA